MVTSRSPCLTSAPSRKCTACTAPATRERHRRARRPPGGPRTRPRSPSAFGSTTATETGTAGAAAFFAAVGARSGDGRSTSSAAPMAAATTRHASSPRSGCEWTKASRLNSCSSELPHAGMRPGVERSDDRDCFPRGGIARGPVGGPFRMQSAGSREEAPLRREARLHNTTCDTPVLYVYRLVLI